MKEHEHLQEFWEDYQHLKREVLILSDTEKRLSLVKGQYDAIFQAGGELYAVLDGEGAFQEVNPAGLTLLGRESNEIIGKKAEDVFNDAKSQVVGKHAVDVVTSGKPRRFDWAVRPPMGKIRQFSVRMAPVMDKSGKVVSACMVAMDLGELEAIHQDLVSLQEAVEMMQHRISMMLDAARSEPRSGE